MRDAGRSAPERERREAERRLLSEEGLRNFIEQLPLTVYIDRLDESSSNVYTSPQLEASLGYTAEQWGEEEDLFLRVVHPDDRARVMAKHRRSQETGEPFRAEYRMVTRDGRVRWFLDDSRDIVEDDRATGYRFGYLLDITERKQLDEAVHATEERYRQLVEYLPLAIYVDRLDELSSNIYTSPQVEPMLGTTVEQWQNEPDLFVRLLHPEDRERVLAEHERTHRTREPLRTEYRLIRDDGRLVWIRDQAVVVADPAGGSLFLQGFMLDITERRATEQALHDSEAELRRQKAYFQELVALSPVAIVTLDLDERITSWNPAAEQLFGHTQVEACGQPIGDLLFPDEALRADAREAMRRADEHGLAHRIARRPRKDGTLVDVELLMVPLVVDGDRTGYLVIYHDITEVQRAREAAESAARAKSAFLATMSHEIRTPMNAVIGMGGLLLDTELTAEQRRFAEVICDSGDALLSLIDDILDFSKIEAEKLELEARPLDLRECVEGAVDVVAVRASEKGLDLGCLVDDDVPGAIVGDVTRLRQALVNLLANAVKFTESGEVMLTVATVEGSDDLGRLRFSVRDTGIGIPAERMAGLFDSFTQVDTSTTRRYGGTGLGLAISRRLAELLGGTLWAQSEEGKGSTFHFEIEAAPAPQPAHGPVDEPGLAGKRLLVVAHNATSREIVRRQAESWGLQVVGVALPSEALVRIRRGDPFDVALLDMQVHEMDAVALARKIRRHRDERTLPLMLLTPIGRLAQTRGATEFSAQLTKPVKASYLHDALVGLFAAELPAQRTATSADGAQSASSALGILVAEDNPVNRQLAVALLAKLGHRADVVTNGLEALDALERRPYDVVLMDVQMPVLDGLEATRQIRARRGRGEGPAIIAMTANAMPGDREACLAAGMDDYVAKPIRVDQLAGALSRTGRVLDAPGDAVDGTALDALAASLGGGDDGWGIVRELIDAFLEDAPAQLAALRGAIEQGDASEAQRAAHTLKSNAATFGAQALAEHCRGLEAMARQGSLEGAGALLGAVGAEWGRARDALDGADPSRAP